MYDPTTRYVDVAISSPRPHLPPIHRFHHLPCSGQIQHISGGCSHCLGWALAYGNGNPFLGTSEFFLTTSGSFPGTTGGSSPCHSFLPPTAKLFLSSRLMAQNASQNGSELSFRPTWGDHQGEGAGADRPLKRSRAWNFLSGSIPAGRLGMPVGKEVSKILISYFHFTLTHIVIREEPMRNMRNLMKLFFNPKVQQQKTSSVFETYLASNL